VTSIAEGGGILAIEVVQAVFDHSKSKGADRLVLLVYANHANKNAICWPSNALVAKQAGLDLRTVKRSKRNLVRNGELKILKRGNTSGGIHKTDTLQIVLNGWHNATGDNTPPVTNDAQEGWHNATGGVAIDTPQPSLNRHKNRHRAKPLFTRDGKPLDEALDRLPKHVRDVVERGSSE
jgi:Helix-turn-helix domain